MTVFGPYPAVVTDWYDGDTCHVILDLGFGISQNALRCRVYGINAPELRTEEGKAARLHAQALLPARSDASTGKTTVVSHGWDKYGGRFDGELTLADGSDFGKQMVADGHAVVMK